jgi:mediator of RNA polymerase II transcription subunit 31
MNDQQQEISRHHDTLKSSSSSSSSSSQSLVASPTIDDGNDQNDPAVMTTMTQPPPPLPDNRFELELEFVQSLASPAYIHFLATSRTEDGGSLLQSVEFLRFLEYLRDTWSRPEYARFLVFPHCLYFLDQLLDVPSAAKEWSLPEFRNFCHQQQFLAWQHRHSHIYGVGKTNQTAPATTTTLTNVPVTTSAEQETSYSDGK